ncbi:MAG: tetratricopeptide repeat protein [Treponema sp.]|nr:tetratricopeptide repeat protein [Treponema sp.]
MPRDIFLIWLVLFLCGAAAACKGKTLPPEQTPEYSAVEPQAEQEEAEPVTKAVDNDIQVSYHVQRPLSDFSGKLPAFGVNVSEISPLNYENPDPVILKQMGVEPYMVSFFAGEQFYRSGDFDKALAEYTVSIRSNGEFAGAYFSRGNAWLKKGDYKRAIDDYTRSIKLDGGRRADIFNYRGYARAERGETALAIEDYSQAIALNPNYTDALINRAHALYETGEYDRVIDDCSRVIRLEPHNASIWNRRGSAWYCKRDDDRAIKDFTEAIRIKSGYALAFYNRGNAWYSKGELDRALADINRALDINPSFAGAHTSRENILRLLENPKSAAADFAQKR